MEFSQLLHFFQLYADKGFRLESSRGIELLQQLVDNKLFRMLIAENKKNELLYLG